MRGDNILNENILGYNSFRWAFQEVIEILKKGRFVMTQKSYEELEPSDILDLEEKGDVEGLITVLRHSRKKNMVKLAVNALGRLKDQKAVQPLIKWGLKSPPVSIRAAAVAALGNIGSDEAVNPLIQLMLKDKAVRAEAVQALGKLRAANAVNALVSVVEDEEEDQQVREKALEALANIADKEFSTFGSRSISVIESKFTGLYHRHTKRIIKEKYFSTPGLWSQLPKSEQLARRIRKESQGRTSFIYLDVPPTA